MPLPSDLLNQLRRLGVGTIRVAYSGSDDSGCIDAVTCLTCDGDDFTLPDTKVAYLLHEDRYVPEAKCWRKSSRTVEMTLHMALEQYCYDVLEQKFAGWEINGGSHGVFELDITAGTGKLEHNARYIDYQTYEMEV